jgi:hypothetical protein
VQIRTGRAQSLRGLAQHRQMPLELLRPAARQQPQHPCTLRHPELARQLRGRHLRREVVHQRMPDVRDRHTRRPEQRLLESEHHRQPVDPARHRVRALGVPRPHLRSDVVEDPRALLLERGSDPQIEAGIVDQYHRVRLPLPLLREDPRARTEQARQPRHDLDESHHRQILGRDQALDALGAHARAGDAADLARTVRTQRRHQAGGMEIARSLAGDEQETLR